MTLTMEQVIEACEADDYIGFCRACGEEHSNIEPDAEHYTCESCGKNEVFGAEQLLIVGIKPKK